MFKRILHLTPQQWCDLWGLQFRFSQVFLQFPVYSRTSSVLFSDYRITYWLAQTHPPKPKNTQQLLTAALGTPPPCTRSGCPHSASACDYHPPLLPCRHCEFVKRCVRNRVEAYTPSRVLLHSQPDIYEHSIK